MIEAPHFSLLAAKFWYFVTWGSKESCEIKIEAETGNVIHFSGDCGDRLVLDGICFPTDGAHPREHPSRQISDVKQTTLKSGPLAAKAKVFHYTSADTAIKILGSGSLRLSPYKDTNDPKESKDWHFVTLTNASDFPKGKAVEINSSLNRLIKGHTRLACFTADNASWAAAAPNDLGSSKGWKHPRMWAQYADYHRGAVIVFDRSKLLQNAEMHLKGASGLIFGHVSYLDIEEHSHEQFHVSYDAWILTTPEKYAAFHAIHFTPWLFFAKASDWVQEHEARLIFCGPGNEPVFVPISDAVSDIVLGVDFPESELPSIRAFSTSSAIRLWRAYWHNGRSFLEPL